MPEQPGTLAEALIRLQATLPRITKDDEAQVGTRTYRYANLASIHDAVFPLLAACGLVWTCPPTLRDDGRFVLRYKMSHVPSGQADGGDYPLPDDATPQATGGAITYARRYALCAYIGIAPVEDDDDAQAAETQARAIYEDRVAAGRMDRAQAREHGQLERDTLAQPKKAERVTAADIERERSAGPGDDWETGPPEDAPGTITEAQGNRLKALFRKIGAHSHEDRMALAMSRLNLPELGNSADLSYAQAEDLARKLENELRGK